MEQSNLIVVNNPADWQFSIPEIQVVSAKSYLTDPSFSERKGARVFNLCRSYRYQSSGYYVSLLAAARGHKPLPNVSSIQDMKLPAVIRIVSDDLYDLIQKSLKEIQSDSFVLSIYFGKNLAARHSRLSLRLFKLFQAPLLRARFVRRQDEWDLKTIIPISGSEIPPEHLPFVREAAGQFFSTKRFHFPRRSAPRYYMAILTNPEEPNPPSNSRALKKFVKAAGELGMAAEFIGKEDYGSVGEYDALFIRETTSVNHHTYRFARRAAAEGLVVMDDPDSILRCTNKVFLAELLTRQKIPTPRTLIGHRQNVKEIATSLGFPAILKQPDSSFSQGVVKVHDEKSLKEETEKILSKSDLFIAQEFLPTDYDWRVGVLGQKIIYVCKYFMAKNHWQIQGRDKRGNSTYGNVEAVPLEETPPLVVRTALKAATLMGNGLYGVDLKLVDQRCYVIEVNDNPSIDNGVEDLLLKDEIYRIIMQEFLDRIENKRER